MKNSLKILSTKTLTAIQKSEIINFGCSYSERNFIETQTLPFSYTDKNYTLLFSSQNAVKYVFEKPAYNSLLKNKTCYCVGEKTKRLLVDKGLKVPHFEENSSNLANFIVKSDRNAHFLFFCGNERRADLETQLKKNKINIDVIEVYKTLLKPKAVELFDAVLFYSPSGVKSFLKDNKVDESICICIGPTTAEALPIPKENIIIASKPSIEHMIYQLKKLHSHD
tara:strand:- start:12397 stop:13068 length:672 start_codon:yes stop_codon:yes gene_type:complete